MPMHLAHSHVRYGAPAPTVALVLITVQSRIGRHHQPCPWPAAALQEFVSGSGAWVHVDTGSWTQGAYACPGRPEGGEALGLRALMSYLASRYGAEAQ
jgi:hypothetical protein